MTTKPDAEVSKTGGGKRLGASDRKRLILEAARRAFSASGDVRGTTIKRIAEEAGISEGMIYRHFDTKEELFVQAAVDPLTEAINGVIEKFSRLQLDITGRDLNNLSVEFWKDQIDTLADLVPLLSLVLFGDPEYSVPFYRNVLMPSIDKVGASWNVAYKRITGESYPHPYASLAQFGMALIFGLNQRLAAKPETSTKMATAIAAMEAPRLGAELMTAIERSKLPAKSNPVNPKKKAARKAAARAV
jgi:AcrR family transcriptional regulator